MIKTSRQYRRRNLDPDFAEKEVDVIGLYISKRHDTASLYATFDAPTPTSASWLDVVSVELRA